MSIADEIIQLKSDFDAVYEAGKQSGSGGYDEGYDKATSDFWDGFQDNGNREYYGQAFRGTGFERIEPKYDFDNSTYMVGICMEVATLEYFGKCNAPGAPSWQNAFRDCTWLTEIEEIDMSGSTNNSATFQGCTHLEKIKFNGTVIVSLNMQWSPLNKASIESVINALSPTATGQTLTINKAAQMSAGFSGEEWKALTDSKTNWTISLI